MTLTSGKSYFSASGGFVFSLFCFSFCFSLLDSFSIHSSSLESAELRLSFFFFFFFSFLSFFDFLDFCQDKKINYVVQNMAFKFSFIITCFDYQIKTKLKFRKIAIYNIHSITSLIRSNVSMLFH